MKTAYAYARFSSDNQREESIDAQLRAIRSYCEREGIRILHEYIDEAYSARTDQRPMFQQMFADIKSAPADYVIVHKLDRFARNRYDSAFYKSQLNKVNMKLVSVLERLDDTPESIIMEGLLESLNEYYSANLAREVRKGMDENIIQGKRLGGKAPYGYYVKDQHLYPSEDAPTVRRLFQEYADGKSMKRLVKETGRSSTGLHRMFGNEVYIGTLVSGPRRHENAHEAIVPRSTWDAVQKRLHDSASNAAAKAKHEYLFSGKLVCGECGRRMIGVHSYKGHYYYTCQTKGHRYLRADILEDQLVDALVKDMEPTPEVIDKLCNMLEDKEGANQRREQIRQLNEGISRKIDNLYDALAYADTADKRMTIMHRISLLEQAKKPMPVEQSIDRQELFETIARVVYVGNKPREQQRACARRFLYAGVVYDDHIDYYLYETQDTGIAFRINIKRPGEPGRWVIVPCTSRFLL